jgi:membrane protein
MYHLVKQAAVAWSDDNAPTLGASLAYYTAFSLAPLLLIAISMGSLIVGEGAARSGIIAEIRQTLGPATADAFVAVLDSAYHTGGHAGVTLIGLATLLLGASGAFVQLQDALNIIWKTEAPPRTGNVVVHFLRHRLLSFTAVLGTGFLLLVSLIVSSVLAALSQWMAASAALFDWPALWHAVSMLVSFGFITLLFAVIFKVLPDAPIAWRDVWIGSMLTAALFTLGQYLIGLYLGQTSVASTYGAAGSLVVLLIWVYYSAQLVLFGAEFTHVYANVYGSRVRPEGVPAQALEQGREAAHCPPLRNPLPPASAGSPAGPRKTGQNSGS